MGKIKGRVRDWLDIPESVEPVDNSERFQKIEDEQWKVEQVLHKLNAIPCARCGKTLYLWPHMTEGYVTDSTGAIFHQSCDKPAPKPQKKDNHE